ncbi:MAG TPA: tetratricopeptide repeat protein [Chloroflexia bacterium]
MENAQYPTFADLLRAHRTACGLTQEELAEHANLSVRAIGDLERGIKRRPRRYTVQQLAGALNLTDPERARFERVARQVSHAMPAVEHPRIEQEARTQVLEMGRPLSDANSTTETAVVQSSASDNPPHARRLRRDNLPWQTTSFIGREHELEQLEALLTRQTVRIVSLTGMGGSGKTRLALEAAASLRNVFRDGVFYVGLAELRDAQLLAPKIAQALELRENGGLPALEALKDYLFDKQVLLLLDNFEHLLPAALMVSHLLASVENLKILVTSRESLRLRGEHLFPVMPLELPDPEQKVSLEELSQCESVHLFVERAIATRPDFTLTQENASAVVEICVRLGGLPLSLELAAARIMTLTPEAMLERLNSHLALLKGGAVDLPTRLQTLRSTVEWSYQLLSEREQQMFRHLAMFRGSARLEAIEEVCGTVEAEDIEVFEVVESLVRKSLINVRHQPKRHTKLANYPRVWMLETLREYAMEQLTIRGEAGGMYTRYASYYLMLTERFVREWRGPNQAQWLARMEEEHDNLRAALEWSLEETASEPLVRLETALRLAGALSWFWIERAHMEEAARWIDMALQLDAKLTATMIDGAESAALKLARAEALNGAGRVALALSDGERAFAYLEQSLVLCQDLGDDYLTANAMSALAGVYLDRGDYVRARSLSQKSLQLWRDLGITWHMVNSQNDLGCSYREEGNFIEATRLFATSLALSEQHGDKHGSAVSLLNLGLTCLRKSDYAQARSYYTRALELWRELENNAFVAATLTGLGHLHLAQGDLSAAAYLFEQCIAHCRALGDKRLWADVLNGFGLLCLADKNYSAASASFHEALALRRQTGDKRCVAESLHGLGLVAIEERNYTAARSALEQSLSLRREIADRPGVASVLASLGVAAIGQGQDTAARRLVRRSLKMRYEIGQQAGIAACLSLMGGLEIQQLKVRRDGNHNRKGIPSPGSARAVHLVIDHNREAGKRTAVFLGAAEALLAYVGGVLAPADQRVHERAAQAAQLLLGDAEFEAAKQEARSIPIAALIRSLRLRD